MLFLQCIGTLQLTEEGCCHIRDSTISLILRYPLNGVILYYKALRSPTDKGAVLPMNTNPVKSQCSPCNELQGEVTSINTEPGARNWQTAC